jgi:Ca2+-binding RTX toxin-like protein
MAQQSDDPVTHDIADDKNNPAVSDDPATHDINDDRNHAFTSDDVTAGGTVAPGTPQAYTGPVQGLQNEYVGVTSHHLNIGVSSDDWFIHTGSGDDAIAVHGGTNVLDGGTGSNFLTGGTGSDTFFVDDRGADSDIWSTVAGFHAGDSATIWGVTAHDFGLAWADGQGAAGFTGLTLHATAAGKPTASLTLAGYSQGDIDSGRLSVSFGTDSASGSAYMFVHGNS